MRRRPIPDDSEEESDSTSSNATVYNAKTNNRKKPSNRGRPPGRQKAKRQRVLDSSSRDTSPQPSTSGLNNNYRPSSESSESESESIDSDYEMVRETNRQKKQIPHRKVGRPKKHAHPNNSVNGVSSNNRAKNSSQRRTSKEKTSVGAKFDAKQIETLAQKLVYFLLIEDQKKYSIKRKAIMTHVFKGEDYPPKMYNSVITKANLILQEVYGMELMKIQDQKDSYLIINNLGRELGIHEFVEMPKLKQQQRGLILYLITVIFMNENSITEDELTKCLQPLGIDLTSKKLHPIFGDVKKYITSELVKQMYLSYDLVSKDPKRYEIKWGIRATQEFDKKDLLQFTCQIMGNRPEEWRVQYRDAEESGNPRVNGNT